MPSQPDASAGFSIHPLTPGRWSDLEALFGPRGACGGCWCMFWRQTRADYEASKGDGNRQALKSLVEGGEVPGLIAYSSSSPDHPGGLPVGWASVAPRQAFSTLQRSRVLKPVDQREVWSIVCFFISRQNRRRGLSVFLIQAAVDFAASQGAAIIEGYPVEPAQGKYPDAFVYTGLPGPFIKAGFVEVARRSPTRPVMRFYVGGTE